MTTLLISGSRAATPFMLSYAQAVVGRAHLNGWRVMCGEAPGIDAQVICMCEKLRCEFTIAVPYGFEPRHISPYADLWHVPCEQGASPAARYRMRDRAMVVASDKVMCITTKLGTPGTISVYNYAVEQKKECWLRRDYDEPVR